LKFRHGTDGGVCSKQRQVTRAENWCLEYLSIVYVSYAHGLKQADLPLPLSKLSTRHGCLATSFEMRSRLSSRLHVLLFAVCRLPTITKSSCAAGTKNPPSRHQLYKAMTRTHPHHVKGWWVVKIAQHGKIIVTSHLSFPKTSSLSDSGNIETFPSSIL
jgi:hypothetical protein